MKLEKQALTLDSTTTHGNIHHATHTRSAWQKIMNPGTRATHSVRGTAAAKTSPRRPEPFGILIAPGTHNWYLLARSLEIHLLEEPALLWAPLWDAIAKQVRGWSWSLWGDGSIFFTSLGEIRWSDDALSIPIGGCQSYHLYCQWVHDVALAEHAQPANQEWHQDIHVSPTRTLIQIREVPPPNRRVLSSRHSHRMSQDLTSKTLRHLP